MLRIFILETLLAFVIASPVAAMIASIDTIGSTSRISVEGRAFAKIELAHAVKRKEPKAPDPRVLYAFEQGEKLGTLELFSPGADFRGLPIAQGSYELTYRQQPPLKDHVDTSEFRDFVILTDLDEPPGEGHPLVLALIPASASPGDAASVRLEDSALVAELTIDGQRVAIVLPGTQTERDE